MLSLVDILPSLEYRQIEELDIKFNRRCNMEFNDKLMQLRKQKGWSQEELGNQISVSRQTISKWELGQTTPEMNKLIEISNIFDISIDELVGKNIRKEQICSNFNYGYKNYEYKSKTTIYGLPLVHINLGRGAKVAKGVIAIGNIAIGGLAIGLFSLGILSIGIISLAILALGSIAVGGMALGGIAIGIIGIGGLAIGQYSIGGCAIAKDIALGGYAKAHIAIGDITKGVYEFSVSDGLDNINILLLKETIKKEFPKIWTVVLNLFTNF